MNNHDILNILKKYVSVCRNNLIENNRILTFLKKHSIYENYIFGNFCIGYSNGELIDLIGENEKLKEKLTGIGIFKKGEEIFKSCIIVPIYDENKTIINIVGYNIYPQSKNKLI